VTVAAQRDQVALGVLAAVGDRVQVMHLESVGPAAVGAAVAVTLPDSRREALAQAVTA
jgi:hypothetical protein